MFINRKPGLRLGSVSWKEDAELFFLLYLRRKGHLYMHIRPYLPPCHLGPAQLIPSASFM
jgi:hypothetical protein